MTIDSVDGHDGHKLKGRIGCGAFPAALALAEGEGQLDDRAFLTASVIGYEMGTRAGIALRRMAADYHTSGAWITVAAAALGSRPLRLSAAATREAVGIAEYHGAAQPDDALHRLADNGQERVGLGAMAGVLAAYLAADGFTGAPAVTVEGARVADLWSDLGTTYRLAEQYYKPFPVCRWAQPAIRAALELLDRCFDKGAKPCKTFSSTILLFPLLKRVAGAGASSQPSQGLMPQIPAPPASSVRHLY